MGFWGELWRGEKSLAFTFWVMGTIVGFSFDLLIYFLELIGFFNTDLSFKLAVGITFIWVSWFYHAFIYVGIWRSANNYILDAKQGNKVDALWGYATKLLMLMAWWQLFEIAIDTFTI